MKKNKQVLVMNASAITKNVLQKIVSNLKDALTRNDQMEGRDYLVVPMVMLTEGVHQGSNGPLYYPKEELAKIPAIWNHKPVVVYHPAGSACDPDILTNRKIGVIMNTKFEDGKLKAEAWLEVDRIKKVDERVLNAIENKQIMELSTGLFTDNEDVKGEWNGEEYIAVARNYRPDHLAVLPDQKGACSVEDGAGLLRLNSEENALTLDMSVFSDKQKKHFDTNQKAAVNQFSNLIKNAMSFDETRSLLQGKLREKNDMAWIVETYSAFFIYETGGSLYKQDYSIDDKGVIKFDGLPVEVVRVTNYRDLQGNLISNLKGKKMEKKQIVDALIANKNTAWGEDDRETLMAMDEKVLAKMSPVANAEPVKPNAGTEDGPTKNNAAPKAPETPAAAKPQTVNEYIDAAPKELQDVLRNGMAAHKAEQTRLIAAITANKANKFTKEQLEAKPLDELRNLAALAANTTTQQPVQPFYGGQADAADVTANAGEEEPLEAPVMNFGSEPEKKD